MPEGTHHLLQEQSRGKASNIQLENVFLPKSIFAAELPLPSKKYTLQTMPDAI